MAFQQVISSCAVPAQSLRVVRIGLIAPAEVPIKAVQELLGHSTIEMTMRYAHLSPDARREAVQLLDVREAVTLVWRTARGVLLTIPLAADAQADDREMQRWVHGGWNGILGLPRTKSRRPSFTQSHSGCRSAPLACDLGAILT